VRYGCSEGFKNSSSCGVDNKLNAIKLTARKIEKERVTVVDLGMNERRSDDEFEEWNSQDRVFRIRRIARMDRKHDVDNDKICSEKVSDESKIAPRSRAEFVGAIVALEGIQRVGSETLESC